MARGNTATINLVQFRADWLTHMPISALCQRWTVSKDQVIRLVSVWGLPRRHDRRYRFKPVRQRDPTPAEIRKACASIQATWTAEVREERRVTKTAQFRLQRIDLNGETLDALGPDEWYDDE